MSVLRIYQKAFNQQGEEEKEDAGAFGITLDGKTLLPDGLFVTDLKVNCTPDGPTLELELCMQGHDLEMELTGKVLTKLSVLEKPK